MNWKLKKVFPITFDNDNNAVIPEVWAMEALTLLMENTVLLPTVNRQFKDEIASQGELVHAHRPRKFEAERKVDGDDVTIQDAITDNVDVRLDFHLHTSFMIYDGERSKSMKDLITLHGQPAMLSIVQELDEIIANMKWRFMANNIGQIGTALTKSSLVQVNKVFQTNLTPQDRRRWFMMSPGQEADLLEEKLFTDASQVGDDGTALREASVGRKFGTNCVMSQNMTEVEGSTVVIGAVNLVAGYAKGTTTIVVDNFAAAIAAGTWLTIAGDDRPRRVVSTVGGAAPTSITIETGIDFPVINDAVVTVYDPGAIDLAAGYATNYTKRMAVDAFAVAPQRGQMLSFGAAGTPYGLVGVKNSVTSVKLERGLDTTLANDVVAAPGPDGEFGFAYHSDAVTVVSRPLAEPESGTGARSAVVSDPTVGVGIRVTITYNGVKQGHLVTIDMLCGTEVLDATQGMLVMR